MTKFAIFGDSYVTHLEKFTGGRSKVSNCRFFGVSGMSTRRKFQDKFDEIKHYRPDVVFMNLGGNDITESTDIQNLQRLHFVSDSRLLSKNYMRMVLLKSLSPPSLNEALFQNGLV